MIRLSRIGRMYKLIKLTRLLRVLKIVKEKSKLLKYIRDILKIGAGFERLFFLTVMFMIIVHIVSCMWVFFSKLSVSEDNEDDTNWIIAGDYNDDKIQPSDVYLVSFYYIITTMTTVGYGDISPTNALE